MVTQHRAGGEGVKDLHRNLSIYLESHGWEPVGSPGVVGQLWCHKATGLSVAVPHEVEEGSLDWRSITVRLAEVEQVSVEQVIEDIESQSVGKPGRPDGVYRVTPAVAGRSAGVSGTTGRPCSMRVTRGR